MNKNDNLEVLNKNDNLEVLILNKNDFIEVLNTNDKLVWSFGYKYQLYFSNIKKWNKKIQFAILLLHKLGCKGEKCKYLDSGLFADSIPVLKAFSGHVGLKF